jgi:hypothetical protein
MVSQNGVERPLEVLRLDDANWTLLAVHKDDEHVHVEPFEDFRLELAILWADVNLPPQPQR